MKFTNVAFITLAGALSLEPLIENKPSHLHWHPEIEQPTNFRTGVMVYGNIQVGKQDWLPTECRLVTIG